MFCNETCIIKWTLFISTMQFNILDGIALVKIAKLFQNRILLSKFNKYGHFTHKKVLFILYSKQYDCMVKKSLRHTILFRIVLKS